MRVCEGGWTCVFVWGGRAIHTGNQLKGEFTKCAVGMELPTGHQLRSQLDSCKEQLEELMDELPGSI